MTATIGGEPTGAAAGGVFDYTRWLPDSTRALSLEADYLRARVDMLASALQGVTDELRERDLADRTLEKGKKSIPGLLEELARERGMGWSDIAEVVGVSISAVRKWRKGGEASPDSRSKLARIAALLDILEEKGHVQDPVAWMEMDLPLDAGYFIRPLDLYLEGHQLALIDLAEGRQTVTHVLDQVRPNWRAGRGDFEVFVDTDGERSIRKRDE